METLRDGREAVGELCGMSSRKGLYIVSFDA
jgi:hypothetical protein